MKLYYTPTPDKWDTIRIIICNNGICVDTTVDLYSDGNIGSYDIETYGDPNDPPKTIDEGLKNLLEDQSQETTGHLFYDLWEEEYENTDSSYPESELPTRHPGAILFTEDSSVHLILSTGVMQS